MKQHPFMRLYEIYAKFVAVVATFSGIATFIVMWLVGTNAFSRKIFNSPITGSVVITEALLTLIVILPMAYTQYKGGHLRVSIISNYLPISIRRMLYSISALLSALFLSVASYSMCLYALHSFEVDQHVWGASFRFAIYPFKALVALGMILFCVQFALDFLRVAIFGIVENHDHIGDLTTQKGEV